MKSLGLYLYDEIASNDYFKTIFEQISKSYTSHLVDGVYDYNLTEKEEKDLFRFVDLLASMEEQSARMKAYHIISLLDVFIGETARFRYIASSVYSKLGLFALNFDDSELPFDRRFEVATKKFSQKFDERYVFTDSQYEIYSKMVKAPHYSFSGPTSLGKSFIIKRYVEDIVQTSRSNIVILVPSKALINQFSLEIKSELKTTLHEKNYSVLTHGNLVTEDDDEKYIFILTPERLLNLYSQKVDITIDFLFVDEAHKLSNNTDSDTRSLTAYSAIENTINNYQNVKVVFSSPNISNPEVFLELFGKDSNHTTKVSESPVAQNLYLVDFKFNELTLFTSTDKYKVETNIFNTSRQANDFIYRVGSKQKSNMVYCSSRDKSISSALSFCKDFIKHKVVPSDKLKDAIEKVSAYIHNEYYLAYFLEKRIAYHHGQLPPVIRNIVEELFRDGEIDFIFCTP
uniref:DEAD/DEAH box helicase n=1 Tax=Vibrio harveyi TaxID=669 RepID=UPI000ACDA363